MRLLIRSISLAVITSFTVATLAQTSEDEATDSETSNLIERRIDL